MKIHQLLSGIEIAVTNEEQNFMDRHDDHVKLTALDDHDQWVAQNLVRRGVYHIAEDNITLIKKINEKYSR
jgi:predicted house-cleaning NTP pyrophosphatase (Maf/HAM1 superfamily)